MGELILGYLWGIFCFVVIAAIGVGLSRLVEVVNQSNMSTEAKFFVGGLSVVGLLGFLAWIGL